MDPLIAHIRHVLTPAQSWSCARTARWVRVWQWRREKLGLDVTPGQARIRAVNAKLGRHVADSESDTFRRVVEKEAGVTYKVAQRWVRWTALGAVRLKAIEGTPQDSQKHLDDLCTAQRERKVAAPVIVGKWKHVEDRLYLPQHGIDLRHGNSRAIMAHDFEPESVGAIISDQPYGVAYTDCAGVAIVGDDDP